MSIAIEIGSRKSGTYSQAQKYGFVENETNNFIVYKFIDGSKLLFCKTSTGKVKPRKYMICD